MTSKRKVKPVEDVETEQLEITSSQPSQLAAPKHPLKSITGMSKASMVTGYVNPDVQVDVQSLVSTLYPWELTKHFHHAVREGDLPFVRSAIKAKPALIDSLDDRLMCSLSYAIKYRRLEVLKLLVAKGATLNLRGQEGTRPLHVAATFNVPDALQFLLQQRGIKIDNTDDKGQTALHVACRRGRQEISRLLLQAGADVLKQENDGVSVLHQPARNGNLELCKMLLTHGASASISDNNGLTPLMASCIEGRRAVLEEFLLHASAGELKKILDRRDNDGASVLHHATQNRQMEIVTCLLDSGANINAKRNDGNTPLHIAALLGYVDLADLLLQRGADPSAQDKKKRTPLHECALNNQPDVAKLLILKGAGVNACDDQFMTPMHWACKRGYPDAVEVLLEFFARLDGHDVCMRTPMHWAVIEEKDKIVERLLTVPGVELVFNKQDMYDKTPLHYAAERGCLSLAKRLIERGADHTIVDCDERRPTHVAAKSGHLDCLRTLIDAGAGGDSLVDQRDQDERTTVLLAAEEGKFDVFRYLCDECGADFGAKDEIGRNSLMLAVAKSHFEIAKFLLDRDIDVNATDVNKNTALHYAAKEDATGNCVRLLLEYSAVLSENNTKETAVDYALLVNNRGALDVFFEEQHWAWTMAYRRQNGRTHMDQLIQHSVEYAAKVLDYCIETTVRDPLDKNFTVIYNYTLIDPGPDDPASIPTRYLALNTMAEHKRLDLLKHPLSMAITQEKWKRFANFSLWTDIVFYALFLICLTVFVVDVGPLSPSEMDDQGCRNTTFRQLQSANLMPPAERSSITISVSNTPGVPPKLTNNRIVAEKSIIVIFLGIRVILELLKLFHKRLAYFLNAEVYFYWILYGTTFAFMYPPDSEPCLTNWIFGLVSILLAWSLILFQIECLPHIGIYSLMFQKVLLSLVKVLLIFGFFILAFALAFYSTMKSSTPFSTVPYAILKTIDMLIGEVELVSYFISTDYGKFQIYVQVVFAAFVIIMPIALVNLLIGVAVGDIEGITRDAELRLLTIRINLIYETETNVPKYFQRRFYRGHKEVYPNRDYSSMHMLLHGSFEQEYRAYKTAKRSEQDSKATESDPGIGQIAKVQNDRMMELEQAVMSLSVKLDQVINSISKKN